MLLLKILYSIIHNQFSDLHLLLQQIVRVLISVITRDLPETLLLDDEDFLTLKLFAGELLYFVVTQIQVQMPDLPNEILNMLLNRLFMADNTSGFVYYGCLVSLKPFGPQVTKNTIVPQLPHIAEILSKKMNNYQGNSKQYEAIQKCFQILLD